METEVEQPSKLRKCFKCFAIATWSVFGALVLLFALFLIFGEEVEDDSATPSESNRLVKYCSYKFTPGSDLHSECIDDGWKDWYANAHWMK